MAVFKDRKNREWLLDLDVYLIEQIEKRTEVKVDALVAELAGLTQLEMIGALIGDSVRVARVLWVMCEEQAANKAPAVTPEDFGRSIGGDALEDAGHALLDVLVSFTPRQKREILRTVLAKVRTQQAEAAEKALEKISAPEFWTPLTTAAGSSDSTPAPAG